jgi:hypothetical protein
MVTSSTGIKADVRVNIEIIDFNERIIFMCLEKTSHQGAAGVVM